MATLELVEIQTLEDNGHSSQLEVDLDDGSTFSIECAGYFRESGKVAGTSLDVPVVRIGCNRAQTKRGAAIWVMGGPFDKLDDGLLPEQVLLLELGYDLILPMYPGSAERKYRIVDGKITPDIRQGFTELGELIAASQAHGPVLLVGESFGALFALQTAKFLRSGDRLMLLGPMVMSFRDTLAAAGDPALPGLEAAMQERSNSSFLADDTRLAIVNNWEPPLDSQSGMDSTEANAPQGLATIVSFFGDWLVTSPLMNFENPGRARVLVVAGDQDPVIGQDDLAKLATAAGPNFTRVTLAGQGHGGVRSLQEIEMLRSHLLRED